MKKEKSSFTRMLMQLILIVPHMLNLVNHVFSTITSEMRLARRYIVTLIILAILFAALLATTWVCLLGMLFLYLVSLHLTWMQSCLILFVLNLLMMIIIGLLMANMKNNFFSATRKQCREICKHCNNHQ